MPVVYGVMLTGSPILACHIVYSFNSFDGSCPNLILCQSCVTCDNQPVHGLAKPGKSLGYTYGRGRSRALSRIRTAVHCIYFSWKKRTDLCEYKFGSVIRPRVISLHRGILP